MSKLSLKLDENGQAKLSDLQVIDEPQETAKKDSAEELNTETEAEQTNTPRLRFVDYSEKAFAIVGDTKEHRKQLKKLGGRYNPKLKCGAGWIFSKRRGKEVATALGFTA